MNGNFQSVKFSLRCLWVALLMGGSLPAHAGLFDDDEARARVDKLRADTSAQSEQINRVSTRLEERLEAISGNQVESANQFEAIRADMARLRGQTEVFSNDLGALRKQMKDMYLDLDNRQRKIETDLRTQEEARTSAASAKPDPAQETRDYETALTLFKGAKYAESLSGFQSFIKKWPDSGLLPNAWYWMASCRFQLKEFGPAAEDFAKVSATWPNDPKAADAMLAQANALGETKKPKEAKEAREILDALLTRYPGSAAAKLARQRLKK
ncbi:MAG: tol-pal system protein YbgF [Rhodocyclaceae bacterium]|nr:tol-pal system protein YbgF [Rhodocyclaceae bacterium]